MPEDLLKFGLIPEFIGRVPVTVTLNELDQEALERILTEPKNALIKQYKKLFAFDDVELEFEPEAISAVSYTHLDVYKRQLLHVPFAIADATALTEAGYVGEDVENILLRLLQNADYDIERAERGIIYVCLLYTSRCV